MCRTYAVWHMPLIGAPNFHAMSVWLIVAGIFWHLVMSVPFTDVAMPDSTPLLWILRG